MLNNLASVFRQKEPVDMRATVDLARANPVYIDPVGRSVLPKQLLLLPYVISPLRLLFIMKSQQRFFLVLFYEKLSV